MLPRHAAVFAVLVALVAAAAPASGDPRRFASAEGRFAARFPGEVSHRQETEQSAAGPYTTHYFSSGLGETAFLVVYTEFPVEIDPSRAAVAVDAEIAGMNGKVIARGAHRLGKVRGVGATYRSTSPSGRTMEKSMRVYVRGRRLYHVGIAGPADAVPRRAAARFLASFRLD